MFLSTGLKPAVIIAAILIVILFVTRIDQRGVNLFKGEQTRNVEYKEMCGPKESPKKSIILKVCPIPAFNAGEKFLEYEKLVQYKCKKLEYFGIGDGGKGVCMDPEFGLDKNKCNVLSFGISNDWTFDDAFGKFGCKVHSFDPTIGKKDHQRSENVKFLDMGIGDKTTGKLDTYRNILQRIGLKDAVIDYLKMDVEYAEVNFFEDVFSKTPELLLNVKQIGMETHYGRSGHHQLFWKYYHILDCLGFKIMDTRQYANRAEVVWGRL